MTHIANCMRPNAERGSVYIPSETSFFRTSLDEEPYTPSSVAETTTSTNPPTPTTANNTTTTTTASKKEKRPSRLAFGPLLGSAKYQFWPGSTRSPAAPTTPSIASERMLALNAGRSPTSLSDTAAAPDPTHTFWHRSGSLSRRRKISVPELGASMTTVQELCVDSPTIPGRPPLRKVSSDAIHGHERSSSAPGNSWRSGPFGDALMSCVTGPAPVMGAEQDRSAKLTIEFVDPLYGPPTTSLRPLSPIISPAATSKPVLKLDTNTKTTEGREIKPEVPPKSPSLERKGSPGPKNLNGLAKSATPATSTPAPALSFTQPVEGRRSPVIPATPAVSSSSATTPASAVERGTSPVQSGRPEGFGGHTRNASDTSIMDRGRPSKKTPLRRQRSRTSSEMNNNSDPQKPDLWNLPKGQLAANASHTYRCEEKEDLHRQALAQAEQFEVLHKRDVHSLSRELRALDERCEYLRKTYKSLREGRQKLHGRMLSYLKRTETQIFSRESLLKQEEALAELDVSIDDFLIKLEQSENRRLRVRQKLLEHVAAALILSPTGSPHNAESTPPRSPVKTDMSPGVMDRSESIKVFADRRALDLFSDIEQAIGKMCEAC